MSDYNYGENKYGQFNYGGVANTPFNIKSIPVTIEVTDNTGAAKAVFQSGVGDFLGLEFSISESGSQDFILYFGNFVNIDKKDIVKIKIFSSDDYFFTGVVRSIPIDGSTLSEYNYSGFGFIDYLSRINTESQNYSTTSVYDIIVDLLDTIITVKTPISKNLSKIDAELENITVTDLTWNYINISQALDDLKKIANSDGREYNVGVDQYGDFFFKGRNTEVVATLTTRTTGRNSIQEYKPEEIDTPISKYYILRNDGTFYKSISSTEDIDINEEKITAPDITDSDIDLWALGILEIAEIQTKSAIVIYKIEEPDPLFLGGDGYIRIISNVPPRERTVPRQQAYGEGTYGSGLYGGSQTEWRQLDDTLRLKATRYIINESQAIRELQLGTLKPTLESDIIKVNRNIENLRQALGR